MPGRCCSGTRRGRASRPGSLASHRTPPVALLVTRPGGPPRPASGSDDPRPSRSRSLPGDSRHPPRSGSEITEIPRRPGRSSSGCRASSRRDARPTTPGGPDAPLPERRVIGVVHRRWRVSPAPEDPSSPVSRAVHRVAHCGAIFCGYRLHAPTRLPSHGRERHSYTACGWSCPQSSTGLLWVFTSAEYRRRRWTTGSRVSRQILTTSWFSPRNLWTEILVHTLWTAHSHRGCAQFCGQLWTKALSVWTGHPRSVDDVWGQIGRPQAPRLSHTGLTGSSTRICAL